MCAWCCINNQMKYSQDIVMQVIRNAELIDSRKVPLDDRTHQHFT